MPKSRRIVFSLGEVVRISPPILTDCKIDSRAGELSTFAPYGNGFYGYQIRQGENPFTNAPIYEASGGVIYFDNDIAEEDLEALMRILRVQPRGTVKSVKDYAVFIDEAENSKEAGYLTQMRIVSKFGLRSMFKALSDAEYKEFKGQELNIVEAIWQFIKTERERWGTSFWEDETKGLRGLFGGDGYFSREELSFGFMVENDYYNVYRIWSRAWLVTK